MQLSKQSRVFSVFAGTRFPGSSQQCFHSGILEQKKSNILFSCFTAQRMNTLEKQPGGVLGSSDKSPSWVLISPKLDDLAAALFFFVVVFFLTFRGCNTWIRVKMSSSEKLPVPFSDLHLTISWFIWGDDRTPVGETTRIETFKI